MFRVALLTALVLAVVPAAAQAHWELTEDGQPRVTTNRAAPEEFELSVCPPDGSACTPVTWTQDPVHVAKYEPGETPVGTTFLITRPRDGFSERSRAWQGRMVVTKLPSISGSAATTNHVAPIAATWTGGWGNESSRTSLVACASPQATGCMYLPPASHCPVPCTATPEQNVVEVSGTNPAALPPVLAGHHLFAVESRWPVDRRGWPVAVSVPLLWNLGGRFDVPRNGEWGISYAVSAPLTIGPTIIEPVPRPVTTAKLRERALRSKGKLTLGQISCTPACRVSVKVSGGGRKAATTTFTVRGTQKITTPVRHGKLTVRVHVDGKLLANGKVVAR